ncbi:mitochondrial aspartate-glutamate transporter agc1 [Rhizophlyctis rosea]|uniref:Mitochondrial aspartate-glutamate transporter AGC1 n=1 Tax=Rhizophlyctis rosea TaxID=64517 RepID=A0AAD5X8Y2_9FUNG|nr:mitochondrial aspartate-glutamate transporter agc1 [Rhizophlyctis rosea]
MGWFGSSSTTHVAASTRASPAVDETDRVRYKEIFDRHASVTQSINGADERFMNVEDFITATTPNKEFYQVEKERYSILFRVADRESRGLISLEDWYAFEALLNRPDAEFEIAFRVLDSNNDGRVTIENVKRILQSNQNNDAVPLDLNTDWVKLFTGAKSPKNEISYEEFAQLLKGFQAEKLKQEFKYFDPNLTGVISPENFKTIMLHVARHKLSPFVVESIPTLNDLYPGEGITFANVRAFHNVIREMDMIERIVRNAATTTPDGRISKQDFQSAAGALLRFNVLTPMEVDIVFHLARRGDQDDSGRVSVEGFERLFDPTWSKAKVAVMPTPEAPEATKGITVAGGAVPSVEMPHTQAVKLSAAMETLKSIYNFALGSVAGAIGATVVYPIDLVKTRMQNQRSKVVGQLLYKNSLDCFQKVIRNEGVMGLYSGLIPQLVGVAPEKAIKLTMNDLVRSKTRDPKTGQIPLWAEIMAGCTAGGSQVLFTNPLEIVKIRLQVQGEAAKAALDAATPKAGALTIVRQLGLLGLYKGVGACLLRDIPFSAIYFPTYAHLKTGLFEEGKNGKKLGALELLTAGAIAGMPAAYLVTPADVIKTRLQVAARKGETTYTGITDAFRKILKEEGPKAFFKGGVARVFRSSPQFGVTLAAYEFLHRVLPVDFGDRPKDVVAVAGLPAQGEGKEKVARQLTVEDMRDLGRRNALRVLNDLSPDLYKGLTPVYVKKD